jgi:hypothetical protein
MELVPNDGYTFSMIFVTFFLVIFVYIQNKSMVLTSYVDIKVKEFKSGLFEAKWNQPANSYITGFALVTQKPFSIQTAVTPATNNLSFSVGSTPAGVDILPVTILTAVSGAAGPPVVLPGFTKDLLIPNNPTFNATTTQLVYTSSKREVYFGLLADTPATSSGVVRVVVNYTMA